MQCRSRIDGLVSTNEWMDGKRAEDGIDENSSHWYSASRFFFPWRRVSHSTRVVCVECWNFALGDTCAFLSAHVVYHVPMCFVLLNRKYLHTVDKK